MGACWNACNVRVIRSVTKRKSRVGLPSRTRHENHRKPSETDFWCKHMGLQTKNISHKIQTSFAFFAYIKSYQFFYFSHIIISFQKNLIPLQTSKSTKILYPLSFCIQIELVFFLSNSNHSKSVGNRIQYQLSINWQPV